jgi:hypothetical protein
MSNRFGLTVESCVGALRVAGGLGRAREGEDGSDCALPGVDLSGGSSGVGEPWCRERPA